MRINVCNFINVLSVYVGSSHLVWNSKHSGIDIILNRLINDSYYLPCFALSVLLEAAAKIHLEEQALVMGTKQSSQADKADRLTRQTG